ncbi:MAG: M36 family metallopeptidase, partial [Vicinamibacterales bacterium]
MEKHAAVRNADLVASMVDARAQAFAQLGASGKRLAVVNSETLGSVEVLGIEGRGVLAEATADRVGTMRAFLAGYAGAYGLSTQQLAELELVADYVNPAGNMAWVEFEQRLNGLPVFQGSIRGGFTAKGELARTAGHLAPALDAGGVATSPSLSAAQAISRAAVDVGWDVPEAALVQKAEVGGKLTFDRGPMASDARAWLAYFPLYAGVARLAWVTEIWGDPDVFLTVQDAEDGTVLWRKNLTSYQTQFARYVTYKSDSPAPSSPTTATPLNHEQAPYVDRAQAILIGNEGSATFNNLGWMTDDTNVTDGNNVEAGLDIDGTNGVDAPVTGSAIRVFNFPYDPEFQDPTTADYRNGEVTNMFYWVNRFHDRTYMLGFTEQSFNFQHDNFGRGGAGNDRISAEGQDSSDTNNMNFSTPADGGRGRMQMYVWTGPTPDRSSGLDQDVMFHELTHGLSNRLHGNATGLSDNMARGLGEGWSDFYARALQSTPDEDANGIYTIGGWVTHLAAPTYTDNYYYGIRRFPYAPRAVTGGPQNRPHSPLTFADADSTQFDVSDGAFPPGPLGSSTVDQVHNLGEIWAGMLWEVRSRFVAREGFSGQHEWLQYVTDGMKLSPLSPNFLQARDAILAAAAAGGATQDDIDDIWAGFAVRGLGVLAAITSEGNGSNDTRVLESVLLPGDPVPTFSINDVAIVEGNAGTATATFTVTLANPSSGESRVSFATADGTATSTSTNDFVARAGQLVFPPGTTTQPVSITINGDGVVEPNETFSVNLSAPGNAIIGDNQGQGTILNDDGGSLPVTVNNAYSAAFNTALTVPAPGVLANDNSNGGGALTALLNSGVSNGTLTLGASGQFTYTPNSGFIGNDTFTYRAVSANGAGNV